MTFNFPTKKGSGISDLVKHVSKDAQDLILKLLIYNPDNRITAAQALKHPYFAEFKQQENVKNLTQPVFYSGVGSETNDGEQFSTGGVPKPKRGKKGKKKGGNYAGSDDGELSIKPKKPKGGMKGKTGIFPTSKGTGGEKKSYVSPY